MRGNAAISAAQRMGRLLLLIGLAVAAYVAMSLLDHAAHADEGQTNTAPPAPVEKSTDPPPAAAAKPVVQKVEALKSEVQKAKVSKVEVRKVEVRKVEVRKVEVRK